MRITVNLDTQAVTTTPSPLRLKAASMAQIEAAFTRGSAVVPLPPGAVIEFGLKAKGKTDTDLLVYSNEFAAVAGTLYAANVNCATVPIEAALGIDDDDASNDLPFIELSAELGWTIGDLHFRSQTFGVFVDAPVISSGAPALYLPPRYPVLDGNTLHFVRGDGTLASVSGGMTTLTTYTGNIGTEQAPAGNIYGTFIGDGSGLTALNPNSFNASNWNGVEIGTNDAPLSSITAWRFVGRGSPCFEGDGSNLYNVEAVSIYLDGGRTFAYSGDDGTGWASSLGVTAPWFAGDGSALTLVSAAWSTQTFNNFFSNVTVGDIGFAGNGIGNVYANYFEGDGSGLWGVSPDLANYAGNIGWGYAPMGNLYATAFYGDGSGLTNVGGGTDISAWGTPYLGSGPVFGHTGWAYFDQDGVANLASRAWNADSATFADYAYTSGGAQAAQYPFNTFFSSITNYGSMDIGQSGGTINNVYANYFYGDGSGLTNVGGGTDVSSWGTPDIGAMGPVFGNTSGNFFNTDGHVDYAGHSGYAANSPNDFFPYYSRQNYDFGESSIPLGTVYANYFVGDGSGLTNVSASGASLGYQNLGSSGAPCAVVYADNLNVGNFVLTNTSPAPETAGSVYFNGTDFLGYDGANWKAFSGGAMPDLSDYGGNIGTYSTPAGSFYGTVGDSDHFNASAFVTYIEAERVAAQNFTVYTAMALPTETFTGSIVYSRHAGGHFYGLTDDGWKQLDNA